MGILDFVSIIGTAFGVAGTLIAIRERKASKELRNMYEEKCDARCKDLVAIAGHLSKNTLSACRNITENSTKFIKSVGEDDHAIHSITALTGDINSIMTQSIALKSLCRRLNDEHKNAFGYKVFEDLEVCLEDGICIPYRSSTTKP